MIPEASCRLGAVCVCVYISDVWCVSAEVQTRGLYGNFLHSSGKTRMKLFSTCSQATLIKLPLLLTAFPKTFQEVRLKGGTGGGTSMPRNTMHHRHFWRGLRTTHLSEKDRRRTERSPSIGWLTSYHSIAGESSPVVLCNCPRRQPSV